MAFTDQELARTSSPQLSTTEWESTIGAQFRAIRLLAQIDQATLAESAGISVGALKNLENGRGSTLKTVICVAVALDRDAWLESLDPQISVSPIAVLRAGKAGRQRAYSPRRSA